MCAALRTKSKAAFGKSWVEKRVECLEQCLLNHSVYHRRDAQLSHPATRLGTLKPPEPALADSRPAPAGPPVRPCARRTRTAGLGRSARPPPAPPCSPSHAFRLGSGWRRPPPVPSGLASRLVAAPSPQVHVAPRRPQLRFRRRRIPTRDRPERGGDLPG